VPSVTRQQGGKRVTSQSSNGKSTRSVMDRIEDISFDSAGIKIVLYGSSGSGKTTLWATFPKPILAIICSGGFKPGELRSVATEANKGKIKQVVLHKSDELYEITSSLKQDNPYKTLVLDHVSGYQDLVLKDILGLESTPVAKTWGLASQQDYGQCTVQCKEYLRSMLDLDCNVVVVAQERTFKDESGNDLFKPTVGASLTPALAGWLHSSADYVCQTFIRNKEVIKKVTKGIGKKAIVEEKVVVDYNSVEYCLRTSPDATFASKFRVPKGFPLPRVIVNPDYDKIYATITGVNA
jgi:hypothetical protein